MVRSGQVAAAVVGIVQHEQVAGMHLSGKRGEHRLQRRGQGADVDRNVLGLRREAPRASKIEVEKSRLEFSTCE